MTLEALETLEELLAMDEVTLVTTNCIGDDNCVLLEDAKVDDCCALLVRSRTELVSEDEVISSEDVEIVDGKDETIDEVVAEAVAAVDVVEDAVELLDVIELEEPMVTAELVELAERIAEPLEELLELGDEEAIGLMLGVEVDGVDVGLEIMVDDREVEDEVELGNEDVVKELLVKLVLETMAVVLYPAPTPFPENVPDAVLKGTLACVTLGLL